MICELKIWTFQFLDEETLLINHKNFSPKNGIDLFSVYNLSTTEIEAVFDSDCKDFVTFVTENIFDFFLPTLTNEQARSQSEANRELYAAFFKRHLTSATRESNKKHWTLLFPFRCQRAHCSPYLKFNEWKWQADSVPLTTRFINCPETCCNQNDLVVFLSQDGQRKFSLFRLTGSRDYLIFHPSDPLVLTACLNPAQSSVVSCYNYHLHFHCPWINTVGLCTVTIIYLGN